SATTAAGGSSTQAWSVTPTGTVVITAVATYWEPDTTVSVLPTWVASLPYPAALVPQSNGTLLRLQGAANADGSFSIPNVPGGHYWLQMNQFENFWTATSDFDFGQDFVGRPLGTTARATTTFDTSVSGIIPSATNGDYFLALTDLHISFSPAFGLVQPNTNTFTSINSVTRDIDWTLVTTLYLSQYQHISSGSFTGYVLGASQTLPNISFSNGVTNTVTGTLTAGSQTSLPI